MWNDKAASIYARALDLDDQGRQKLLDTLKTGDSDVYEIVRQALAGDDDLSQIAAQSAVTVADRKDLTDHYIEPYRILELIGQGAQAAVYKAYDTRLKCLVAIKVFLPAMETAIDNEIETLAKVTHPNILRAKTTGTYKGRRYFVTDLAYPLQPPNTGYSEDTEHQVNFRRALDAYALAEQMSSAITYLLMNNILHRDIKPSNILRTSCDKLHYCLADFGLAVPSTPQREVLYSLLPATA